MILCIVLGGCLRWHVCWCKNVFGRMRVLNMEGVIRTDLGKPSGNFSFD